MARVTGAIGANATIVSVTMMNRGAPKVVRIFSRGSRPELVRLAKALKKTATKPLDLVSRDGGTRTYFFVPSQKTKVAIAIKTPGTANAML